MRGLRIIDVAPGESGALMLQEALRQRLFGEGPAVAAAPEPSRHVTATYAAAARDAVTAAPGAMPGDVAVVVATSGSTGLPRGVLLTESNLKSGAHRADLARPGLASCAWILALPVTSVAGLNVVARSLLADSPLAVLPSVGGSANFDPADLLALEVTEPFAVSLVPSQLRLVVDNVEATRLMAAAHTVLVGGAATDPDLLDRARAAGIPAVSTYGMTETTGGCVFDGIPLPDVLVSTDDTGRISVAGPTVAAGYLRPGPGDGFAPDGWFTTGDVGRWDGQRLSVLGRHDDIVTVHGVNVSSGAIEHLLLQVEDVREVAVVAVPDPASGSRLIAYVVLHGTTSTAPADLADAVREQLGGAARPQVVWVDALPRLPNGKIDRLALRNAGA
ncbi:MAG: AMP-binding protein [Candidatus Nanopelagicales bacterium]|jgi:O-succinylbenzoic acid--CoA ligase